MSDITTPRTDAACEPRYTGESWEKIAVRLCDTSIQLETELSQMTAKLESAERKLMLSRDANNKSFTAVEAAIHHVFKKTPSHKPVDATKKGFAFYVPCLLAKSAIEAALTRPSAPGAAVGEKGGV